MTGPRFHCQKNGKGEIKAEGERRVLGMMKKGSYRNMESKAEAGKCVGVRRGHDETELSHVTIVGEGMQNKERETGAASRRPK